MFVFWNKTASSCVILRSLQKTCLCIRNIRWSERYIYCCLFLMERWFMWSGNKFLIARQNLTCGRIVREKKTTFPTSLLLKGTSCYICVIRDFMTKIFSMSNCRHQQCKKKINCSKHKGKDQKVTNCSLVIFHIFQQTLIASDLFTFPINAIVPTLRLLYRFHNIRKPGF